MTESFQEASKGAVAILASLRDNLAKGKGSIEEKYVVEFHDALDSLEQTGFDLSQFRVPPSHLSRAWKGFVGNSNMYSDERYVEREFLLTKLGAVIIYLGAGAERGRPDVLETLNRILSRFHQVARQLRVRHDSRETLDVHDEYDVQDLLHALLKLHFDDIRSEEWTPSYAGSASRMDFLLKNENTVIEVKKTSERVRDNQVGQQLIVDIAHYKEHPHCQTLVCFVYDPEGMVGNPAGLEQDLSASSVGGFQVKAWVFPK